MSYLVIALAAAFVVLLVLLVLAMLRRHRAVERQRAESRTETEAGLKRLLEE